MHSQALIAIWKTNLSSVTSKMGSENLIYTCEVETGALLFYFEETAIVDSRRIFEIGAFLPSKGERNRD